MYKTNLRMMVDEHMQLKLSDFFETKDGMVEPTLEQINKWDAAGLKVKYIRFDNGGENKKLKARSESSDWKMNITCEFTAQDTPQQHILVEIVFAVVTNCSRELMAHANFPIKVRYKCGMWHLRRLHYWIDSL